MLREATKLRSLSLDNPVDDADMDVLRGLGALGEIQVRGVGITQRGLESLAELRSLRALALGDTSVHDIRPLRPVIAGLSFLDFHGSPVDDEGLKAITGASGLLSLVLSGTRITDDGLGAISGLRSLQRLWLDDTAITDDGLARLVSVPKLGTLSLNRTGITDRGLAQLASIKTLKGLWLFNSSITDAGLADLVGLRSLSALALDEDLLTDVGIGHLAKMRSLRVLYVVDEGRTAPVRARLEKALPKLAIQRDLYSP